MDSGPDEHSDLRAARTRRDFIKLGMMTGLGVTLGAGSVSGCTAAGRRAAPAPLALPATRPLERVRIGLVGVGGQGSNHVNQLLRAPGAEIRAICDIVPERVTRNQAEVEKAGQPRPTGYDRGPWDFKRLCEQEDLDLVLTATPWEWHVPVCVAAMQAGKHAATEVPAAVTLDECWQLVETAEQCGKHCVMLENCCYDRPEMLAQPGAQGRLRRAAARGVRLSP